jgi:hypothetical protein
MMIVLALALSEGGNARNSIATPTGVSMPPPTPWMTRKVISCPIVCAVAHRAEPSVKATNANMNVFFVPMRSPSHPDAGIHTARLSV